MKVIRNSKSLLICAAFAIALAAPVASAAELLEKIKTDKVFTVATEARFAPFEFVEDSKIVGYSADIMAEIMKALPGVELKRLDLPWQGILPGLAASRFDYVVTSVTVTPERMKAYHLSAPIADATMAVLKRKGDTDIAKPEDIAGKPVGSQAGSAQLAALEKFAGELKAGGKGDATISTYTDFSEAYADLGTGRIKAVINSLPNLLEAARQRPDVFEVVLPTFGAKTYFSWAGRNDAQSASLNALMDAELVKLNKSGKLGELQKKWFGATMELPEKLAVSE
ncbi:transporter substrate-binding domain-containing protein (plasmid) [Rhizobium ruizarguesonis]|jgi:polar amino acid transport system substrate-binding protein|uniref:Transporter substrate-binding domain-containing protein n=1 Tax=Rhizobium ruizarguesonis TaxID=2081791 RepID=A0ABY1X1Y7_9HYPH|nr:MULTISPECIES: transporter substrate-binding domain-containing protein [Rhizobium]MBY5805518.1 transporter substrate-binding domain-containing protein [Rhizobium leguminosarum]QJS31910.1 transporter substrate-binding domain-containing protein [Rhizobium leguminosarum bv. trifolii TA1]MBC2808005.1 transporter substrate-binding domain-containing protein [Rhizobium ruizarguesonis]MBY5828475.1 transporter substrate-binding domain-containing protein [Rhizobium leguminosarum]MBY5857248.1 transport